VGLSIVSFYDLLVVSNIVWHVTVFVN
jgi:hypothetical protein